MQNIGHNKTQTINETTSMKLLKKKKVIIIKINIKKNKNNYFCLSTDTYTIYGVNGKHFLDSNLTFCFKCSPRIVIKHKMYK